MKFAEYFKLNEKSDMSGDKFKDTLYIASTFDKDKVTELFKSIDTSKAEEIEDTPHVTFYYSPKVEKLSKDKLYELMDKHLNGFKFTAKLKEYHVFKGVNRGTQDVVVVKIEVDDDVKEKQKEIQKIIEDNGGIAEQTYDEWKPHMTVAYYKKGEVPELPKLDSVEMEAKDLFFQYGGSDQEKKDLF